MTFLELVNELIVESGSSEPTLTTIESGITVQAARLRDWTSKAWVEVQEEYDDWAFMTVSSATTIAQYGNTITPSEYNAGAVSEWDKCSFKLAASGGGFADARPIYYQEWDQFRRGDGEDSAQYGKPHTFSIRPQDDAIVIAPSADLAYELFYDYQRTPQVLALNTDVPICPARFHRVILGKALMKYAMHENAPDAMAKGRSYYHGAMNQMSRQLLPKMRMASLG